MKKIFLIVGVLVGATLVGLAIYLVGQRARDKQLSPEAKLEYHQDGFDLSVFYSQPSKRGRVIFGGLVPYGELWRTGANEATVFATETDVMVGDKLLKEGRHQLLTIPGPKEWIIIFNDDIPGWGIDQSTGKPYRSRRGNEVMIAVKPETLPQEVDPFTVTFEKKDNQLYLSLKWDNLAVPIPIALPG